MKAGDGGEVVVKVTAQSPHWVTVSVTVGTLAMGQLSTSAEAVASAEGRRLIMDMVDRGLLELLKSGGPK